MKKLFAFLLIGALMAMNAPVTYAQEGGGASPRWKAPRQVFADMEPLTSDGSVRVTLDTHTMWVFNAAGGAWSMSSGGSGFNWLATGINFWDASAGLPVGPAVGNIYICSVAGTGWTLNHVYTWSGAAWTDYNPAANDCVFLTALSFTYIFDGASWRQLTLPNAFLALNDAPHTYVGMDYRVLKVNGTANALEYAVLEENATGDLTVGNGLAAHDYTITVDGETNDLTLTWMEDENYLKSADDILMDVAKSVYFRATSQAINSTDAGRLDLVATTSIDLNTPVLIDTATAGALIIGNNAAVDYTITVDSSVANLVMTWLNATSTFKIDSQVDVNSHKIINVSDPTANLDAANKYYVDTVSHGILWLEPIINFYNPTPGLPPAPTVGDRYIATATANGWTINHIYECVAPASWAGATDTTPVNGNGLYNNADSKAYLWYVPTAGVGSWIEFGSIMTHNSLGGLQGGKVIAGANEFYHLSSKEYGDVRTDMPFADGGVVYSDSNVMNVDTAFHWDDVANLLILGEDVAGPAVNIPGYIKMIGSGNTAFFNTFLSGANTADANYTLPTARPTASNYVLSTTNADPSIMSWVGGGSIAAPGADTQVIFNNAGVFGADAGFTYILASDALTLGEAGQSGSLALYSEVGVTDYIVTLQPSATMTESTVYTLPVAKATSNGYLLASTTAGIMSWTSPTLQYVTGYGATSTDSVSLQNVLALTLGKDETPATPNIAGQLKMFGAGDTAFYNTFTSGVNSANGTYTLPTAMPSGNSYALISSTAGVMSWNDQAVLSSSNVAFANLQYTGRTFSDSFIVFTDTDTTPTVLSGNYFLASNSVATSITNFTNGVETQVIAISFTNGNTTLKHGATISMQGGVDYTALTGDTITLVLRGTTWSEIGRVGILPSTYKVKVSATDTTGDWLSTKLVSGTDIGLTVLGGGGVETYSVANTSTLLSVSGRGATTTNTLSLQNASALVLGKDETPATPNIAGSFKMFAAGDNAFYNTFTSGANSANATYTLPLAMPTVNGQVLGATTVGTMSWQSGGSIPAPGSDTQVIYNASGVFGADAGYTFVAASDALTLGENGQSGSLSLYAEIPAGTDRLVTLTPSASQSADTSYTLPTALPGSAAFFKSSSAGVMSFDTTIYNSGTGASGQVAYYNGTNTTTSSANFTFDGTNAILAGTVTAGGTGQSTFTKGLVVNNGAGSAAADNFQVKGDTLVNLIQTDVDNNRVCIGNATPVTLLDVAGVATARDGLVLGVDAGGGTPNTAGTVKLFSAGDNAWYTTITAATQSADATYTLPTAMPAANNYALISSTAGVMSWNDQALLTTSAPTFGGLTVTQATVGNVVATLQSTATADDPNYVIYQNRTTTASTGATTIHTLTLNDDSVYLVEARVIGRRTGGAGGTTGDVASYVMKGTFKRSATGAATLVGSVDALINENNSSWDANLTPSGNNVLVTVTGDTDNNITWHVTIIVQNLSS